MKDKIGVMLAALINDIILKPPNMNLSSNPSDPSSSSLPVAYSQIYLSDDLEWQSSK